MAESKKYLTTVCLPKKIFKVSHNQFWNREVEHLITSQTDHRRTEGSKLHPAGFKCQSKWQVQLWLHMTNMSCMTSNLVDSSKGLTLKTLCSLHSLAFVLLGNKLHDQHRNNTVVVRLFPPWEQPKVGCFSFPVMGWNLISHPTN